MKPSLFLLIFILGCIVPYRQTGQKFNEWEYLDNSFEAGNYTRECIYTYADEERYSYDCQWYRQNAVSEM